MHLPISIAVLFAVLALGVPVTFTILIKKVPEEDYGVLSFVIWALIVIIAFAASVTWYLWVWFWLWGRIKDIYEN